MLSILVFSALLPVVLAQYNYPAGSSSAAVVATPIKQASTALQTITVGKGGRLNFDPESLVVASGSKVVFEFYPGHHSVVQGSFDKPCSPSSGLAFYSGTVDSNNGPAAQVFTVAVDNTDPIWFYCGTPSHCQDGMVGVINPSTNQTFDMYKSGAASSTKTNLPPSNSVQGGVLATPSSAATSASTTSATAKSEAGNAVASIFGIASSFLAFLLIRQI